MSDRTPSSKTVTDTTFPNARYVYYRAHREFYETPEGESRRMVYLDGVLPIVGAGFADEIASEGGEYMAGIRFLPTDWHCIGHMSIEIEKGSNTRCFVAMSCTTRYKSTDPNGIPCSMVTSSVRTTCVAGCSIKQQRPKANVFSPHFAGTYAGTVDVRERLRVAVSVVALGNGLYYRFPVWSGMQSDELANKSHNGKLYVSVTASADVHLILAPSAQV